MAIWHNLSKAASDATAKAVEQAKTLTEITRLNSLIADEEKRMNDYYLGLGKRYAELFQADHAVELEEFFTGISECGRKIQAYRAQIQNVKGVVRCEKCGAEVSKGAAFCSACGTQIPVQQQDDTLNNAMCQKCGAKIEDDMLFCTSCGTKIVRKSADNLIKNIDTPTPADLASNPSSASQEEEGSNMSPTEIDAAEPISATRVCVNCGAPLGDVDIFCTECGTRQ